MTTGRGMWFMAGCVQVALAVAKLEGAIRCSWWMVFAGLWSFALFASILYLGVSLLMALVGVRRMLRSALNEDAQ